MTQIAERVATPPRIGLAGRPGAGRRTVARALAGAGITVTVDPRAEAEVLCYVLAETVKPEDAAAVAAATAAARPVLVVVNKSDIPGGADPAAVAARIGAPTVPMAALFAVAAGDGRIDTGVRAVLRALSGVDAVAGRLDAVGAVVRYRRMLDAVARLQAAVGAGPTAERVAAFLAADATVLARMAAATEVLQAARLDTDSPDGPVDRLSQAVRWRRCATAPLSAVYRGCAADIARGALRLWAAAAP